MNRLSTAKRTKILNLVVEGNSLRAIGRLEQISKDTVASFLCLAGHVCIDYQDNVLTNIKCKNIQVDEIWSFVYSRDKNVPIHKFGEAGDYWTWIAICADTKLVPTWNIGQRNSRSANIFMQDLKSRLSNRIQLSSDGLSTYLQAVNDAFGKDIDYARTIKVLDPATHKPVGAYKEVVSGNPDPALISTSFIERENLNIRMGNRRFTRLTNAHSKKLSRHSTALGVYFMHHNFVRIHMSLNTTPAVAANVASKPWSMEDVALMVERWEYDPVNYWRS